MKKLQKIALGIGSGLTALQLSAIGAYAKIAERVELTDGYASDMGKLLSAVLQIVMVIAALLVFIYLIWGGIEWITSGGDKGKTEGARNKITAAVIGLIVLAASYAILTLALKFIGVSGGINQLFDQGIKPIR